MIYSTVLRIRKLYLNKLINVFKQLLISTKHYMPDYNNCCTYKLCCKDPEIEDFYIDSIINTTKRRHDHKKCGTNPKDNEYCSYTYQFIRDNGGWNNFNITSIHDFSCNSKLEQHKIERAYIEKLKP